METVELRETIRPLRRWWWLLLASTLVAVASAYLVASRQPPSYESRGSMMIGATIQDPNPNGYDVYLAQQLASTYSDLLNRQSVRGPVMETLGLTWLPGYSTRVVPNTQLMELTVIDTDPLRAQAVAQALIRQLIAISPAGAQTQRRQEFVDRQLDELQAGIEETKAEIERRQEELATLFSARQIADSQTQIGALQDKLTALQTNYAGLLATTQKGAANTITVVEEPQPGAPVADNFWYTILTAAAIGLLLAVGGAFLIEYLDDSLKNSDDLQKVLGLITLGAVPVLDDIETDELVMLADSQSPAAEAFRILRTNLSFAAVAHSLTRLLVTSPLPGEGKSIVSANLAAAMAQAGRRVILVDADMHRPRQHRIFKLRNNLGLTTALLSEEPNPDAVLQHTITPNLRVLTTGPLPPNPAELLGSQRMDELLIALGRLTDILILDSPPVTVVADTAVLSTQVDAVLLVVHAGKSSREPAKRAVAALRQVNAHVVGAVLNRLPARGSGYYYYNYYSHHYRRYYRRDDNVSRAAAEAPTALITPRQPPATNGSAPIEPAPQEMGKGERAGGAG